MNGKGWQNTLQKYLTGKQELWNRLSEQKSYKGMSRAKDKAKLLTCALKYGVVWSAA